MRVRVVANAIKSMGGGEMTTSTIVRMLTERGHEVIWHPTTTDPWPFADICQVGPCFWSARDFDADLLLYTTNNTVVAARDPRRTHPPLDVRRWQAVTDQSRANVMLVNWQIRHAWKLRGCFDRVAFLNSTTQDEWCRITGASPAKAWVHAPPVDLDPFLAVKPDYHVYLAARHSQSWKWSRRTGNVIAALAGSNSPWRFHMMGAPPQVVRKVRNWGRCWPVGSRPVPEFLSGTSVFWYPLPPGFTEQGPRVIVEAMASGLACLVDNRDGPKERVSRGTGWVCDSDADYLRVFRSIGPQECEEKGEAARERARSVFNPWDWADWLEEVASAG